MGSCTTANHQKKDVAEPVTTAFKNTVTHEGGAYEYKVNTGARTAD